MTPRDIINEAASHGVPLSIRDGRLRYQGEAQAVAAVLPLLREHKTDIINELSGGPAGSPAPSIPWACPLGHREFWLSDFNLKICAKCHPRPVKGGAAWKQ